jgi:hypothetical protein
VAQFTDPLRLLLQQKQLPLNPRASGEPDSARTHRIMEVGVEKWWNGAMAAKEDTKLARELELWMKSLSTEVDAPAMASIDMAVPQNPSSYVSPLLVLRVARPARERESEVSM